MTTDQCFSHDRFAVLFFYLIKWERVSIHMHIETPGKQVPMLKEHYKYWCIVFVLFGYELFFQRYSQWKPKSVLLKLRPKVQNITYWLTTGSF